MAVPAGRGGDVRGVRGQEMDKNRNPAVDKRIPVWEASHQLIRALNQSGEGAAGAPLARRAPLASGIRALAYRLHTPRERKNRADDARAYNELVIAWPDIEQASMTAPTPRRQEQAAPLQETPCSNHLTFPILRFLTMRHLNFPLA